MFFHPPLNGVIIDHTQHDSGNMTDDQIEGTKGDIDGEEEKSQNPHDEVFFEGCN